MAIEGITTLGESTLASGYTAGSGTMALVSGVSFPAAGYTFSVRVNSSGAIYSCTRSTNTLTVTLESGSDVNLSSGAAVVEVVTARSLYGLLETFNQVGVLASLPSTLLKSGQRYQATDGLYNYLVDGSVWRAIYGSRVVVPPVAADFAWVNQGTASVSHANGGMTVIAPLASGQFRMRVANAPGATFAATTLWTSLNIVGNTRVGVCLRESATGKIVSICSGGAGTGNGGLSVDRWTNATSFSAQVLNTALAFMSLSLGVWAKVELTATDINFYLSTNGYDWSLYYTEAKAAFFTTAPDQAGIFIAPENAPDSQITLVHFTF